MLINIDCAFIVLIDFGMRLGNTILTSIDKIYISFVKCIILEDSDL